MHKPGELVEVTKGLERWVEIIAEEKKPEKIETAKAEDRAEIETPEVKAKKPSKKKG